MQKVYNGLDLTEAVLLKDYLVQHEIGSSVRNKGVVRRPSEGVACEVWVADDADGEEVRTLIRRFFEQRKQAELSAPPFWRCPQCREENPGQFEVCWNCGKTHASSRHA